MRWILNSGYVLRGWKNAPFFLEHFPDRTLIRLNAEEAAFLMRCDGQTQIDPEGWPKEPDWVQRFYRQNRWLKWRYGKGKWTNLSHPLWRLYAWFWTGTFPVRRPFLCLRDRIF